MDVWKIILRIFDYERVLARPVPRILLVSVMYSSRLKRRGTKIIFAVDTERIKAGRAHLYYKNFSVLFVPKIEAIITAPYVIHHRTVLRRRRKSLLFLYPYYVCYETVENDKELHASVILILDCSAYCFITCDSNSGIWTRVCQFEYRGACACGWYNVIKSVKESQWASRRRYLFVWRRPPGR